MRKAVMLALALGLMVLPSTPLMAQSADAVVARLAGGGWYLCMRQMCAREAAIADAVVAVIDGKTVRVEADLRFNSNRWIFIGVRDGMSLRGLWHFYGKVQCPNARNFDAQIQPSGNMILITMRNVVSPLPVCGRDDYGNMPVFVVR